MNHNEVLTCALDIGECMLTSGAEVYRVEDCIRRICHAYGAVNVDVFSITSSILLMIEFPDGYPISQTRRVDSFTTDFYKVDRLNDLSRRICAEKPDYTQFRREFCSIAGGKHYGYLVQTGAFALIASSFTLFFGGNFADAIIAAMIGIVLKATTHFAQKVNFNRVLSNLIASFVMTLLAFVSARCGLAHSVDRIVIGNIMLLIPGVHLTNAMRDMISGDTMTGILRFAEAIILALAIAGGYMLAYYAVGGGTV